MKQITDRPWPQTPRDREPPQFASHTELHQSPSYGPHICAACWGAGWVRVQAVGYETSGLVACSTCNRVDNQRIGVCWQLSRLVPTSAEAPSLETFRPHDTVSKAMLQAARGFVQRGAGWLTYWGTWGGGKSHLAEGIARAVLGNRVQCVYMRAPDMYAYLGAVERRDGDETDYAGRMRFLQEIPVLVVDEINKEKDTEAVRRYRITLFDHRYQRALGGNGGATVLVSNDRPDEWHDAALASRAQDSRFVCMMTTNVDFRRVKR